LVWWTTVAKVEKMFGFRGQTRITEHCLSGAKIFILNSIEAQQGVISRTNAGEEQHDLI
jgi:hypothetical protein